MIMKTDGGVLIEGCKSLMNRCFLISFTLLSSQSCKEKRKFFALSRRKTIVNLKMCSDLSPLGSLRFVARHLRSAT
jgi:hypothetical protein